MIAEELEKLKQLKEQGAITEDEYQRAKEKLLGMSSCTNKPLLGMEPDSYNTLLHLSQFFGFIVPGAGFAAPIVFWVIGKDQSEEVDWQGRTVINWLLSLLIYFVSSILLCFVLIGFLVFPVLVVMQIIFPIIGAVKAGKGERWTYPLSIPFFTLP